MKSYRLDFLSICILTLSITSPVNAALLEAKAWVAQDYNNFQGVYTNPALIDATFNLGAGTLQGRAYGEAVDFTKFKASAQVNITNYPPGSLCTATNCIPAAKGQASSRDTIRIQDSPPNSSMEFIFKVSGNITTPNPPDLESYAWLEAYRSDPIYIWDNYEDHTWTSSVNNELLTISTPMGPTNERDIGFSFGTTLFIDDFGFTDPYDYSAEIDFSATLELIEILITDANGDPIPGATLLAESGTIYPLSPLNSVPIPAAFYLFGSALLGLIGIARKNKAA